jgi:signal peptidase I
MEKTMLLNHIGIFTIISSLALLLAGYFSSSNPNTKSITEPSIYFGSLLSGFSLFYFLGTEVASILILLFSSLGFASQFKNDNKSVLEKSIYDTSKEFLILMAIVLLISIFSEEIRTIFNAIIAHPLLCIIATALLGCVNVGLKYLDIPFYQKVLNKAFYVLLLVTYINLYNVESLFVLITIISGIVKFSHYLQKTLANSVVKEFSNQYFIPLFIIAMIRFFIIQPYQVPTGSLEPTVMPGDFLLVNQYAYGLRLPITQTQILPIGKPKRGDIAVFQSPVGEEKLVKRVIGLPGDHLIYKNKQLIINSIPVSQTASSNQNTDGSQMRLTEHLPGKTHDILIIPNGSNESIDISIPEGHYFMMGDNRDNSGDSRIFGPVDEKFLIGKAFFIWMNWNPQSGEINESRIGQSL